MTEFQLLARQPFLFHTTIRSHGWYQLVPFMWDETAEMLGYTIRLRSGKICLLRLSASPGGASVTVWPDITTGEQVELAAAVSWMLALDRDLTYFYAAAASEPKLQRAVNLAMGRQLRSPTLFEDVVRTILTTNTQWAATKRMCLALVEQYGEPLEGDIPEALAAFAHPARRAFPAPESLAAADETDLRSQTRLGYRAPYILELSRRVASGELDLEALKDSDLPTPELRKRLLAIKGVGGYAAAVLLMILGRYDAIPVDSWALKSVSNEWYAGGAVTAREVEAAFAEWGEWRGLAYWFWEWSE